jgi:hypothetical protein
MCDTSFHIDQSDQCRLIRLHQFQLILTTFEGLRALLISEYLPCLVAICRCYLRCLGHVKNLTPFVKLALGYTRILAYGMGLNA